VQHVRNAPRPDRARAERTAKQRLRQWIERLLGIPALLGGLEYATDVAQRLDGTRVGTARNPDLHAFLRHVPPFLHQCAAAPHP
jgi:hypothetical protein